jgi:hypothetical protein
VNLSEEQNFKELLSDIVEKGNPDDLKTVLEIFTREKQAGKANNRLWILVNYLPKFEILNLAASKGNLQWRGAFV